MISKSTNSIKTCSNIIYDSGGPSGKYSNNDDSKLTIYPETSEKLIFIKGEVYLEDAKNRGCNNFGCDFLYIYDGVGTNGKRLGYYHNLEDTIPILMSSNGPITIHFTSDSGVTESGFKFIVGCKDNSQTIYDVIKNNNCYMISCGNNWRNIQKKIVSDTGECVKECSSTRNEYEYRGKCYNVCPDNTINNNNICYSNTIIEKCEEYSIESEYNNLCIKCKNNYYPKLNDKKN